jgi:outer membrane protein TolC
MLILLFAAILIAADGPEPPAITLEEAVRTAIDRHPDVQKARTAAEAMKGRIREVRAQALPEVTFVSNATRWRDPSLLNASGLDKFPEELRAALIPSAVNLFDYAISFKQPLYTAGKVGTALKLAGVEAEGALAEIDRSEQDLSLAVVKAFYAQIWAERYQAVVNETQQQKQQHADMARTRYANGVATEVDVLRSEVAVANGKPDVTRAENAIRQARAMLNFYLVRETDSKTKVLGELEEKEWKEWDLQVLSAEAARRRPELVRLRIAERSAAAQLELARAESRMRVDLNSGFGLMSRLPENLFNSDFTRWNVAVNFSLPVFDGFKRSGRVWQAVAQERAAKLDREKTEQQVRLALRQGLDDLAAARDTIAAARTTVGQADRVLAMTQNNYK